MQFRIIYISLHSPYFTQGMEGVISDAKGLLCRVGV